MDDRSFIHNLGIEFALGKLGMVVCPFLSHIPHPSNTPLEQKLRCLCLDLVAEHTGLYLFMWISIQKKLFSLDSSAMKISGDIT